MVLASLWSHVGKPSSAYGWSGGFSGGSPVSLMKDRLDISEIFLKKINKKKNCMAFAYLHVNTLLSWNLFFTISYFPALIYECLVCISSIKPEKQVMEEASRHVRRFIRSSDNNLRYVGKDIYSRLSLSRNPMDSMKHFEISVLRHIRFVELTKTIIRTTIFNRMNM